MPQEIRAEPSSRHTPSLHSGISSSDTDVSIHVVDVANDVSFDCNCRRSLLVSEMRFFQQYFQSTDKINHTSITVFCDIVTFQWLMRYIKSREICALDASNVLSILVSSEFLQMPKLVDRCIQFFCSRIHEIAGVVANIDCIQPETWDKIATYFEPDRLCALDDSLRLLKNCQVCGRHLTVESAKKVPCQFGRRILSLTGKWIPVHVRTPEDAFFLSKSTEHTDCALDDPLRELYGNTQSWETTFWCVWNAANPLFCFRCKNYFQPSELEHGCRFHRGQVQASSIRVMSPIAPVPLSRREHFSGNNEPNATKEKHPNIFSCCGAQYRRFDPFDNNSGCEPCKHNIQKQLAAGDPVAQLTNRSIRWLRGLMKYVRPQSAENDRYPLISHQGQYIDPERCNTALGWSRTFLETPGMLPRGYLRALKLHRNLEMDCGICAGDVSITNTASNKTQTFEANEPVLRRRFAYVEKTVQMIHLPKDTKVAASAVWDKDRNNRHNQDAQREDDIRRMRSLVDFLVSQRSVTIDPSLEFCHTFPKHCLGGIISQLQADMTPKRPDTGPLTKLPSLPRKLRPSNVLPFK